MVEIHSSCFLSSFLSSPAFPLPHRIAKNGRIGGGEMGFFLFPFFGERRVCVCVCVCVCVWWMMSFWDQKKRGEPDDVLQRRQRMD